MTEKLRQSLSAAMDDEADAFELRRVLDELGRDPELRSLWDRYHLIGSALRGDGIPVPDDLRERIWTAIDADSEVPMADIAAFPEVSEPAAAPATPTGTTPRWGRYTGLAVAASVAFAVVLGVNAMWNSSELPGSTVAGNDPADAQLISGGPAPTRVLPELGDSPVQLGSEVSASDVQRAQAYILHHTQQQAINQAGVIPFVKLATYEAP